MKSLFEKFFNKQLKEETAKQISQSIITDSRDLTYIGQYAIKKRRELARCRDTVCSSEHAKIGGIDYGSYSSVILYYLDEYFKAELDKQK